MHWGKRELAYPIDDEKNGYYVVAQFSAPPEVLTGFERTLKLDEDLLRHLVVISEGELPTPPSDLGAGPDRNGDREDSDDVRPKKYARDDSDSVQSSGDGDSGDDSASVDDSDDDATSVDDSDDGDSGDDVAEEEA